VGYRSPPDPSTPTNHLPEEVIFCLTRKRTFREWWYEGGDEVGGKMQSFSKSSSRTYCT